MTNSDTLVWTTTLGGIPAQVQKGYQFSCDILPVPEGQYSTGVIVDSATDFPETDESTIRTSTPWHVPSVANGMRPVPERLGAALGYAERAAEL
jgi:hypothetical protein